MHCPTCSSEMETLNLDNQPIKHCPMCGGSFFEQNGINRITAKTANQLAGKKKQAVPLPNELSCPLDESALIRITDEEAIPIDVEIFRCPSCYGLFAPPDDLKRFKKAQRAKIQFFKIWGKPMPSPRAVLAFGVLGLLGLGLALNIIRGSFQYSKRSIADEQIKNIYVKKIDGFGFISFLTTNAYRSKLIIRNAKTGKIDTINVSTEPTQVHVYTIKGYTDSDVLYYQIVLVDQAGNEIKTEEHKLVEKNL